ncbi:MAG: lipopolysaccharide heptosyltransferase II [Acidobacteriota bacterium]|nr:lipopolysaccharide heptosyltransferase II [Acidobacteriota bacterium]
MKELKAENLKRVVVRGTNWVGDTVMTVPALRALRRLLPEAHITLATRPFAKGLFTGAQFIDDLLVCDHGSSLFAKILGQAREWRSRHFDLAILFPNSFEAAAVAWLGGAHVRMGYATERRGFLLSHHLEVPAWRATRHETFYYLNIIAELEQLLAGRTTILEQEPAIGLDVTDSRQAEAVAFLRQQGVHEGRPLIALCPGSINSRAKRWPAERFASLADRFIEELGADVVLIGSAEELDVSLDVSQRMRRKSIMLTGKTELDLAVAVLNEVDLLVTNDTGPAHIAAALDRPTLVIFGPTNPLTTRPLSSLAEIVRYPPDCAPCMLRDCPIDHRCMTAITPEDIFDRAVKMLGKQPQFDKLQFVV